MKKTLSLLLILFHFSMGITQTKVAILDFENTSGISKYDGFGKALSNMLITDLKNSIHPRKITFLERSQLNKILSEQNLQKSKNFDKGTAVSFGKLAGVKYVLVGSVYVMDGTCNITSRLVDVQTSEIVHAKESNGSISKWLILKSTLAEELSKSLNHPIVISKNKKNIVNEEILSLYAKGIYHLDNNQLDSAISSLSELKYSYLDFEYTDGQIDKSYQKAQLSQSNIKLRQKAYILNLHKTIPSNPEKAWSIIEKFWNGSLDEKYPYLEYVFLSKVYESYKDSINWLKYPVTRHGVTCELGDMLLYSLAYHAQAVGARNLAINYQQIRDKNYSFSELDLLHGLPIDKSIYRWSKIKLPNHDTIYYEFFTKAQLAIINGIGLRNESQMKSYLDTLMNLLDYPWYDFIASEYYFPILNKNMVLLNPYQVIAVLNILVGTKKQKEKWGVFINKHKDKIIYGEEVSLHDDLSKGILENTLILKLQSHLMSSSFNDYLNKNWLNSDEFDFSNNSTLLILNRITASIAYTANYKFKEGIKVLQLLDEPNIRLELESVKFYGLKTKLIKDVLILINSVRLGKVDKVKWYARQLNLEGVDISSYLLHHTEFLD
jgi:TolB-like protein